jgi:D-alanine-D-alanine ligase
VVSSASQGENVSKINKHIEIIRTDIKPFGSMSQKTAERVRAVLEKHFVQVGITVIRSLADLRQVVAAAPDLVYVGFKRFPPSGAHHSHDEVVWVSEFLEQHGVNYTGSPRAAIELELNKERAKLRVHEYGIKTAQHFTARPGQYKKETSLPLTFPLFIKPLRLGQGLGVDEHSVVRDFAAFQSKVQKVLDETGGPALVETYLSGREFSVGILEQPDGEEPFIMPVELVTEANHRGDRILGHEAKSAGNEQLLAVTENEVRDAVVALAWNAFQALGARDYGRVDVRLDARGVPNFLEANLIPGPHYFPEACRINKGMAYDAVIMSVATSALRRQQA